MSVDPTPDLRAMSNERLIDLYGHYGIRDKDGMWEKTRNELFRRLGQRDRLLAAAEEFLGVTALDDSDGGVFYLRVNPGCVFFDFRSLVAECKEGQS